LVTLEDEGALCVVGTSLFRDEEGEGPWMTTYEVRAPVAVRVILEECAGGCAEEIEASCEVAHHGDALRVTASGSYRMPGGSPACPAVCRVVEAVCASEPLKAGSYAVAYAGQQTSFEVPDTVTPATIGSAPCEASPY
jgi:hypothetical protein